MTRTGRNPRMELQFGDRRAVATLDQDLHWLVTVEGGRPDVCAQIAETFRQWLQEATDADAQIIGPAMGQPLYAAFQLTVNRGRWTVVDDGLPMGDDSDNGPEVVY